MNEFTFYVSFLALSILLFIPSLWARRASSRNGFTITAYRIFFKYNVALMITHLGISRTGNIPLTDIEDAPFIDLFSFIVALIYGYMMASLRKPDQYSNSNTIFYKAASGARKSVTINLDRAGYFLRVTLLVFGGAIFYTAVFNYVLSEMISLEPQRWRLVGYITYPIFVVLGIWGVRIHHRKHGYTL
jgi:hypothetical protein